jgi:hypothetical protein
VAATTQALCLFVASVAAKFGAFDKLNPAAKPEGWTMEALAAALAQLGLPTGFYALYNFAVAHLLWSGFLVMAALIFWRRSDDWMALFVALMLVTWPVSASNLVTLLDRWPIWRLPIQFLGALGALSIQPFFLLFPDGRFVPRWTSLIAAVWIPLVLLETLFPKTPFDPSRWPALLVFLLQVIFVGTGMFAQIYRYRRVSSPLARQQTKWLVFGVTLLALVQVAYTLASQLYPVLTRPGIPGLLYQLITPLFALFFLLIPASLAIAILRYRLWDIDVIIRRTLIYSVLTAILALTYFASVVLFQQLFRTFAPGSNQFIIVLSTLLIAALIAPLRRRVQAVIDGRFYRRKVDAGRVLAAFSATLRNEVELDKLSAALLRVVEETMQPAQASLWLKKIVVERKT